jgi:cell division protein FtsI (penicillin-binding protein 3)
MATMQLTKSAIVQKKSKAPGRDWRVLALEIFFLCFGLVIVLRLIYIQVWQREKYQTMAKVQHLSTIPLLAQRGLIYDRHQNLLAVNEACVSVGVELRQVKSRAEYAEKLAPLLGESAASLREKMSGDRNFAWLRRRVDPDRAQKIRSLKLPGVRLEKDSRRRYPHDESAAHVIGYTDVDNLGIAGIEMACDSLLRGVNGRKVIQRDAIGNTLPEVSIPEVPPANGKGLILTIDYILQTITHEELRAAMNDFEASSGIAIIINPTNGEILAMACEPSFNPNYPAVYSTAIRRNRAITDLYEPGSTFKLVTFSGIFQEKKRRPDDAIFCENGAFTVAGETVRDHEPHDKLPVREVAAVSSNIGTVKLARLLGKEKFFQYARDYGFGMSTGLELDGEVNGVLKNPVEWSGFSLAAMAMGYEVAVTPIQMAMAYGAIANGGLLLKPRIVAGWIEPSGEAKRFDEPETVRRVISKPVAKLMANLLEGVVDHGTAKTAAIPGLRIAGKTGTAHKPLAAGRGYARNDYIASFVGFFPANEPRYLIFVMLENPRTTYWGGFVAAPTFKKIAQRVITTMSGKEQKSETEEITEMPTTDTRTVVVPDVTGRSAAISAAILEKLGLDIEREGKGDFVLNQNPAPGSRVEPNATITLDLFEIEPAGAAAPNKMPNLVGLSVREALQKLAFFKIEAMVHGSGRVVRQFPSAGTAISSGMRCEIECQAIIPAVKAAVMH